MDKLSFFLTITLIFILLLKPKSIKNVIVYSVAIPLFILISLTIVIAIVQGIYYAGQWFFMLIISSIISGTFFFFSLRKKLENGGNKFPILLLIVMITTWGLTLYKNHLQSESGLSYGNKLKASTLSESKIRDDQILVEYEGVSFFIPQSWSFLTQEINKDYIFNIVCKDDKGANYFIFQWIEAEIDLEEHLNLMKSIIPQGDPYFSEMLIGRFQNKKTFYSSYKDDNITGEILNYHDNGRTFLIIHQGDSQFYSNKVYEKIISTIKIDF